MLNGAIHDIKVGIRFRRIMVGCCLNTKVCTTYLHIMAHLSYTVPSFRDERSNLSSPPPSFPLLIPVWQCFPLATDDATLAHVHRTYIIPDIPKMNGCTLHSVFRNRNSFRTVNQRFYCKMKLHVSFDMINKKKNSSSKQNFRMAL